MCDFWYSFGIVGIETESQSERGNPEMNDRFVVSEKAHA